MRTTVSASKRPIGWAVVLFVVGLAAAGCGGSSSAGAGPASSGKPHSAAPAPSSGHQMPGMGGMDMSTGNGLTATAGGVTFMPAAFSLPAGRTARFRFHIMGSNDKPVTTFKPDQTKLMHFYLIRSDLTWFQHVHPTMAADGTWTAPLAATAPGRYRAYASFMTTKTKGEAPLVLSHPVTVPGKPRTQPLPPASGKATVDGYTLTLSGQAMAGMEHPLTVTVRKDGRPVTNLQPYLDTDAHLTAFHQGDLAFAHLHPTGGLTGGPRLPFDAMLPKAGKYRMFVQFQTGGRLHTAALTLRVR